MTLIIGLVEGVIDVILEINQHGMIFHTKKKNQKVPMPLLED